MPGFHKSGHIFETVYNNFSCVPSSLVTTLGYKKQSPLCSKSEYTNKKMLNLLVYKAIILACMCKLVLMSMSHYLEMLRWNRVILYIA